MSTKQFDIYSAIAVDLGSSSVKVLRADLSDNVLRWGRPRSLRHQPHRTGRYLEWNVEQLVLDLVAAESKTAHAGRLAVSLDSWGAGIVFVDRYGSRIGPVRCYKDPT